MTDKLTLVIPEDIIARNIAEATVMREEWAKRLTNFREGGHGRLRIGGEWETSKQAVARLQAIVEHHTRTIELIKAFRAVYSETDA